MVGDRAKAQRRLAFDQLGAHVRSHDDNRVSEIDLSAKAVRDFALFQNLEQEMHDIGMSLFDLIEEHNRVGAPSNGLGKLSAFFVAHIARRRTDQARPGEFLRVLRHVDLNQSVEVTKHELRQGTCQKRFANHTAPGMIGKSHLVQAIGREVLKAGFLILYRSIFDLVRELLIQETQIAESRLLNKYLKPDLLIIDLC
jgi:hypothetical protein